MTDEPRIMTPRLAVVAAFRSAYSRYDIAHRALSIMLERWARDQPPMTVLVWPGPADDHDERLRRQRACTAAIEEAVRQGEAIPREILDFMKDWGC